MPVHIPTKSVFEPETSFLLTVVLSFSIACELNKELYFDLSDIRYRIPTQKIGARLY